eukprot:6075472-Prymnesium_polylepis.2
MHIVYPAVFELRGGFLTAMSSLRGKGYLGATPECDGCASLAGDIFAALYAVMRADGRIGRWRADQLDRMRSNTCNRDGSGAGVDQPDGAVTDADGSVAMGVRGVAGALMLVAFSYAFSCATPLHVFNSAHHGGPVGSTPHRSRTAHAPHGRYFCGPSIWPYGPARTITPTSPALKALAALMCPWRCPDDGFSSEPCQSCSRESEPLRDKRLLPPAAA